MAIELRSYIVAFIDLLGFSAMVAHDCESPNGEQKFIESLYKCHEETKGLRQYHPELQLIQFSDSVVFALPYSINNYKTIVEIICGYQYSLLSSGILCRGGISYGKHFSTEDFLFSSGMIGAYSLESKVAITPRVIISNDLLDLVGPEIEKDGSCLPIVQEHDGLSFIDYLGGKDSQEVWSSISKVVPSDLSKSPSIRNKQLWLINYYNYVFPENVYLSVARFS